MPLWAMIWASLAAGSAGSRQKRSPCALHRDHPSQQVDAALGEQDDNYVAADAVLGEPVGDDRAPTRELAVTEPNPAGGHCRGVRRPLCLLGKSIEKSAWSVKSGLGAVPIDEQASAFFRRQQRQPRIRCLGSATIASSSVCKCAAIRSIVAASKRSVLYSNQPRRTHPRRTVRASGRRARCRGRHPQGARKGPARTGIAAVDFENEHHLKQGVRSMLRDT